VQLVDLEAPDLAQDFGEDARQILSRLILEREVIVDSRETGSGVTLALVSVDGVSVNLKMAEAGAVWDHGLGLDDYLPLEQAVAKAKANRIGIWAKDNPVAPWEFKQSPTYEQAVKIHQAKQRRIFADKVCRENPGWSRQMCEAIARGQVSIGMTERQALLAWGSASDIRKRTTAAGVAEVWCYDSYCRRSLSFSNGKLVAIDE